MPEQDPRIVWENLLSNMDDGLVVPIVGQNVLLIDRGDGVRIRLHQRLAQLVAERLQLKPPPAAHPNPLHATACAQLERGGSLNDLHNALRDALRSAESLPVPEPLQQLAKIGSFTLFVSTTFDSFLARAIDEVRFGGNKRTEILEFSPFGRKDLSADSGSAGRPTVFHLMGRMPFVREYAMTEEDTLEFMHALQDEGRRPARLFEELDRRRLLLIGNGFNDWLARFFIRTAKRERLFMAQRRMDFVAEEPAETGELRNFLRQFSEATQLFDEDPVSFIAQLYEKWTSRHRPAEAAAMRGELPPMRPGAVFVSYAREDERLAGRLCDILRAASLDVWHDRTELQPGDPWEAKLLLNIQNAAAFVPLVSRHTLTPDRRFFRVEWDHAGRMQIELPANRAFIFPVVIDETSPSDPAIPTALRARQWTPFTELSSTGGFVAALQENVREFERRTAPR